MEAKNFNLGLCCQLRVNKIIINQNKYFLPQFKESNLPLQKVI